MTLEEAIEIMQNLARNSTGDLKLALDFVVDLFEQLEARP
jgi:hypothetical protein